MEIGVILLIAVLVLVLFAGYVLRSRALAPWWLDALLLVAVGLYCMISALRVEDRPVTQTIGILLGAVFMGLAIDRVLRRS